MTKPMTRTQKLATFFSSRPNEWISAFVVQDIAKRSDTQEVSRCRSQFGMTLEHEYRKRGKVRMSGWIYRPAKGRKAA